MARPSATVDLKGNDAHLKRVLANSETRVKSYARNVGNALRNVAKLAAVALPAAALAIGFKSVQLAREQIQAERKLEAVVRATGQAAGFTADQLKKMAADLQKVTNFGDEVTISGQAVLATFREIKGDVFRDAIKSAQDMSTVLGTDLQSSVLQIGKALNDPIKGITALSRAGVSFTQDQKDLIKTLQESGDIMGAQRIILAELAGEFGGAAEAGVDPLTQAFNALGDQMEKLGLIALPTINEWATAGVEALEGLDRLLKETELDILNATRGLDALADNALVRAGIEAARFGSGASGTLLPEFNREAADEREARRKQLEEELFTIEPGEDVRKGREEQAVRRQAFEAANEGRPPETMQELLDFEAELEIARRKGALAAADLTKAEDEAAEATAKRHDEIDAFEQKLRDVEGIREEPADQPIPEPPEPIREEPDAPEPITLEPFEQFEPFDQFNPFDPFKPFDQFEPIEVQADGQEPIAPPSEPEEPQGNRDKSADQIALDKLVVDPFRREELQGIIDANARKQEQRELDVEGENLREQQETPHEKLEQSLARFARLFDAESIDEGTRDRARDEAISDFETDIPDFRPSDADDLQTPEDFRDQLDRALAGIEQLFDVGAITEEMRDRSVDEARTDFDELEAADFKQVEGGDPDTEDRGFQARFEGITDAFTRISTAAASRAPEDKAIEVAKSTEAAIREGNVKTADMAKHTAEMAGTLVKIEEKELPPAVAG